jgi:hypothetical protein
MKLKHPKKDDFFVKKFSGTLIFLFFGKLISGFDI